MPAEYVCPIELIFEWNGIYYYTAKKCPDGPNADVTADRVHAVMQPGDCGAYVGCSDPIDVGDASLDSKAAPPPYKYQASRMARQRGIPAFVTRATPVRILQYEATLDRTEYIGYHEYTSTGTTYYDIYRLIIVKAKLRDRSELVFRAGQALSVRNRASIGTVPLTRENGRDDIHYAAMTNGGITYHVLKL